MDEILYSFCKNLFYKNVKAETDHNFKKVPRTYPGWFSFWANQAPQDA